MPTRTWKRVSLEDKTYKPGEILKMVSEYRFAPELYLELKLDLPDLEHFGRDIKDKLHTTYLRDMKEGVWELNPFEPISLWEFRDQGSPLNGYKIIAEGNNRLKSATDARRPVSFTVQKFVGTEADYLRFLTRTDCGGNRSAADTQKTNRLKVGTKNCQFSLRLEHYDEWGSFAYSTPYLVDYALVNEEDLMATKESLATAARKAPACKVGRHLVFSVLFLLRRDYGLTDQQIIDDWFAEFANDWNSQTNSSAYIKLGQLGSSAQPGCKLKFILDHMVAFFEEDESAKPCICLSYENEDLDVSRLADGLGEYLEIRS